jgi:hypothetical protein
MRPRVWARLIMVAGLGLSLARPAPASSWRRSGGGISVRFRSGGFSAQFRAFAHRSRSLGYSRGWYGGYYPGWDGYYFPRRFYPPNYYGGYFSVYPAFGYGYPYDDFPIYDFPVYAGLPLVPVGFLSPDWVGWNAPLALWPRLYFGSAAVSPPAVRVVELPPRVIETPESSSASEREARPERERPTEPPPAGGEAGGEKGARVGAPPPAPVAEPRTVVVGRFRLEWGAGARTRVSWTGDPRVLGELQIEELDAARQRVTRRRIDAYPFRAAFERDPRTRSLRVTALAGDETVATAIVQLESAKKGQRNEQDPKGAKK